MAYGFIAYFLLMDPLGRETNTVIVGIAMIIAMITAVRGMIQLYKGRKGEKNAKFIIALIGNSLGILYLILTFITALNLIPKLL